MRHFFYNIRPRPAALIFSLAVAALLAAPPDADASIDSAPVAAESSRTACFGPLALDDAVTPALDAGYGAAAGSGFDHSGQGPRSRGADGIEKRAPRRYRWSSPDALEDFKALAQAVLFPADALGPFPAEAPPCSPRGLPSDPRAPPRIPLA